MLSDILVLYSQIEMFWSDLNYFFFAEIIILNYIINFVWN